MPEALGPLRDFEFRIFIEAADEVCIAVRLEALRLKEVSAERDERQLPADVVEAAFDHILELRIARSAVPVIGPVIRVSVALWHGALPIDLLPPQGKLEVRLGEDDFAWSLQ